MIKFEYSSGKINQIDALEIVMITIMAFATPTDSTGNDGGLC